MPDPDNEGKELLVLNFSQGVADASNYAAIRQIASSVLQELNVSKSRDRILSQAYLVFVVEC